MELRRSPQKLTCAFYWNKCPSFFGLRRSSSYYFKLRFWIPRLRHLTGNHALKRLARFMKDHSRATGIATRIRDCLSLDSASPRLTVSIGVAVRPEDDRTARELLGIADRRRYQDNNHLQFSCKPLRRSSCRISDPPISCRKLQLCRWYSASFRRSYERQQMDTCAAGRGL